MILEIMKCKQKAINRICIALRIPLVLIVLPQWTLSNSNTERNYDSKHMYVEVSPTVTKKIYIQLNTAGIKPEEVEFGCVVFCTTPELIQPG